MKRYRVLPGIVKVVIDDQLLRLGALRDLRGKMKGQQGIFFRSFKNVLHKGRNGRTGGGRVT